MPTATPIPGKLLLSPGDHILVMIDFQSQMAFATKSIDAVLLRIPGLKWWAWYALMEGKRA